MTASTKSQRITPEREPQLPCWLWGRVNIIYPSPVSHWRKSSDMPNAGVQYLPGWPTDKNRPGTFLATHWHPDQPDAPQEVPERWSEDDDRAANGYPGSLAPSNGTNANNPPPYRTPAPSKETIADEAKGLAGGKSVSPEIATAIELLPAKAALLRLFQGKHLNPGDRHSDALYVKEAFEEMEERLAASLRAIDRAGEAKGADAEDKTIMGFLYGDSTNEELVEDMTNAFLCWPLPESVCADPCTTEQGPGRIGTHLLSFPEAKQMFLEIVGPLLAAPRPPASVDAGTPRTETPILSALERALKFFADGEPPRPDTHRLNFDQERKAMSDFTNAKDERRAEESVVVQGLEDALAAIPALTAHLSSLAVQLEEAKALFVRHTTAVATFLNELYAIAVDPLADEKMEVSEIKKALLQAAARDRDLRSALAEKEKECADLRRAYNECWAGSPAVKEELESLRARLAALEEDKRNPLLGTGTPWPIESLLKALVVAEDQLCRAGRDFDGWESVHTAASIAQQRLAALSSENPRTLREGEEK